MAQLFNVQEFKSSLINGGARPNQFFVRLSFPTFAAPGTAGRKSQFLVSVAELPGQTVNPAILFYRGREVKLAGDRVYAPWTTTVLNDSQFTIRTAIENWMNGMDNLNDKTGRLNPAEYQQPVEIYQLDRNGGILKSYTLIDAFPVDLSPVGLDFGANDQISTFTCTWQYQRFELRANDGFGGGNLVDLNASFNI